MSAACLEPKLGSDHTGFSGNGDCVAAVVESAIAGDHCSWETLVHEFGTTIRTVARSHRLGDADAADVAQATWLRLLEHLDRLHEPGRVGAWLATTARRECLRVLRDYRRHVAYGDDAPEQASAEAPLGEELLAMERNQALWRGFSRLRDSDQLLLRLLLAEPRPAYDEISAALDMPVGSIGPTRARALERLRNELDSEGSLALMSA
jgi:RNA polymerase sigma factor (sigma-70 family)